MNEDVTYYESILNSYSLDKAVFHYQENGSASLSSSEKEVLCVAACLYAQGRVRRS